MASYTKLLQFDKATREKIVERDNYSCLFCKSGYHIENMNLSNLEFNIFDIMHFIPKSKLGLGIEQNGVLGCRAHHHLLDNGNKGLRSEMLLIMEEYLKQCYEDWDKSKLVYKKWSTK
jgi:predicted restriction endonuclease